MKFLSREKLSKNMHIDNSGYLICTDAVLARTGKQQYRHYELYQDSDDDSIIDIDRPEKEVFDEKTLASFENKPICDEHPDVDVTPENYNELAVGFVRDVHKGVDNGQPVMLGTLVITDADVIEEVQNGKRQLSCGYDCDLQDGDNGMYQCNIRGNHVALCEEGRAGIARIVDSKMDDAITFEEIKKKNPYVDENFERVCKTKLQNLQKKLQSAKTAYLNYGQTHNKDKEYQRLYDEYSTYFEAVGAIETYLDDMRITRQLNTTTRITKESYDMAKDAIKLADSTMKDAPMTITTQCYVFDGDKILIQDRVGPTWKGLAVPGGHTKANEDVETSCIRETKEETGLDVSNLQLFGTHQYTCEEDGECIAMLYKTSTYVGDIQSSEEGEIKWMSVDEVLSSNDCAEGFKDLLTKAYTKVKDSKVNDMSLDRLLEKATSTKKKEYEITTDEFDVDDIERFLEKNGYAVTGYHGGNKVSNYVTTVYFVKDSIDDSQFNDALVEDEHLIDKLNQSYQVENAKGYKFVLLVDKAYCTDGNDWYTCVERVVPEYQGGKRQEGLVFRCTTRSFDTTISYSKLVYCSVKHAKLSSDEVVDHLNGDHMDNRMSNWQVVSSKENARRNLARQFARKQQSSQGFVSVKDLTEAYGTEIVDLLMKHNDYDKFKFGDGKMKDGHIAKGNLYDVLDEYLTWEGIQGYTSEIIDVYNKKKAYIDGEWQKFGTGYDALQAYLDWEGIYGYTTAIVEIIRTKKAYIDDSINDLSDSSDNWEYKGMAKKDGKDVYIRFNPDTKEYGFSYNKYDNPTKANRFVNEKDLQRVLDSKVKDKAYSMQSFLVYNLCVKYNFYTSGSSAEYEKMLANCDTWSIGAIAQDISKHSVRPDSKYAPAKTDISPKNIAKLIKQEAAAQNIKFKDKAIDDFDIDKVKKHNKAVQWLKDNNLYDEYLEKDIYKTMTEYEYAKSKGMKDSFKKLGKVLKIATIAKLQK